jgi:uncharacterized protein YecE (DUF72 family)
MAHFYIGCAVWGYKDWLGDLFPAGSRSANFLSLYSRMLTTKHRGGVSIKQIEH